MRSDRTWVLFVFACLLPATDFDGVTRSQGAAWHIGAYEWH